MEADNLLCSRNARSRTPLVGRAQWKIHQPPSLGDNERAWMEHLYHSMRANRGATRLYPWILKYGIGITIAVEDQSTPSLKR